MIAFSYTQPPGFSGSQLHFAPDSFAIAHQRSNDRATREARHPRSVEEEMRYDRRMIADDRIHEQRLLMIDVECYAGHRGEQTPRALILGDRRIAVAEVLDAWLAPDHRYFKLRGLDGNTYLVRHDGRTDGWELTMFRAEHAGG